MPGLTISLPESLIRFVESQVAEGGYESASDYLLALLQQAKQRELAGALESKLLEGLASGEPEELTGESWDEIRRLVRERVARPG